MGDAGGAGDCGEELEKASYLFYSFRLRSRQKCVIKEEDFIWGMGRKMAKHTHFHILPVYREVSFGSRRVYLTGDTQGLLELTGKG